MRTAHANRCSKFFKATAMVFLLCGSVYANAQVTHVSAPIEHGGAGIKNAIINNIGTSNGMLLFEVKVDNVTAEKFHVIVKDIDGTILFESAYSDRNFAKKFMIPKPESDKLVFVIKGSSGNMSQSFEIDSNTRVVEDVVIKRI